MTTKNPAPAGSWPSPITSDLIVAQSVRLSQPTVADGRDWWLEGRPQEAGRTVLVSQGADGVPRDETPAPFSVRSRAHEYGGGAYLPDGERIWFINAKDQRLYCQRNGTCTAVTAASARRFADLCLDTSRDRLLAVCEDHGGDGEAQTTLVAIDLASGTLTTLASGADFYSSPTLNDDATRLAFLSWDHPNMPWDETTLNLCTLREDGAPGETQRIGRPGASLFQPTFGHDGALYYAADYSDWWSLYRYADGEEHRLTHDEREYAHPQWVFGMRTFAFLNANTIIAIGNRHAVWTLNLIDTGGGGVRQISDFPWNALSHIEARDSRAVLLAGGARSTEAVVALTVDDAIVSHEVLKTSSQLTIDDADLSVPEPVSFASGDGEAHGFYYPPTNRHYTLPANEAPPLLVKCHGGPTAATTTLLEPRTQYWTSRGFAVLDLNYRGSTGFGRRFRQTLYGRWGVSDVEDCVSAVMALAARGLVDLSRCVISGSSAGGYTVLAALTFADRFAAGASYYGIGDLATLALDTHKFEARYTDQLVGPYPREKALYQARSPLYHADRISAPIIFFQGLDDKVVPPNQAESMVDALAARGIPVAYVPYAGEGHGFRNADNIKYSLDAELHFYGRVLGFTPAGDAVALTIRNSD